MDEPSSTAPDLTASRAAQALRWLGKLVLSLLIIGAAALGGRGLAALTGLPIPSSLWGMGLLLALLQSGLVKLSWIEVGAGLLLGQMALFFVPPAVGLLNSLDVMAREWPALLLGTALTTLVLLGGLGRLERRT